MTDRPSNEGISGWYIILVTISANTHLAARTGGVFTKVSYDCIRNGDLRGWKAFSAILMLLQILMHWVATITLLAVYVSFRRRHNDQTYFPAPASDPGRPSEDSVLQPVDNYSQDTIYSDSTTPSNRAILSTVITHAVIIFSPALWILLNKLPVYGTIGFGFFQQGFYLVLAVFGLVSSFVSAIPQIYLMVSRYHAGLGLGSLSVLSLG
ncbi:hypothetical protein FE257_000585 [Aspergillus nanangensis]|uniref:Uncharacterized protein n=1 Tax=Aspergillus nanangensis TaxID=2582783 RepID=A0AAD4CF06_ASPNN|nr:hypothetical protein FE257_000585 [Aspergillus nanangensis]